MTFAMVFLMTRNIIASVISTLSSTLPDIIEGKGFLEDQNSVQYKRWRRRHRTWTHWFVPYATILLACLVVGADMRGNHVQIVAFMVSFLMVGALLHILQDAICGKVPLLKPSKKDFGVRLFTVGSIAETVVVLSGVCAGIAFYVFWK